MAASSLSVSLAALSDPQAKEIQAIFALLDTDRDGRLSPRGATKLCELLGFAAEREGMPSLVSLPELLSWCNDFQAQATRSKEVKLAQRFSLLHGLDGGGAAGAHRISHDALMRFLEEEQHVCRPEAIDALFDEFGEGGYLTKAAIRELGAVRAAEGDVERSEGRRRGA